MSFTASSPPATAARIPSTPSTARVMPTNVTGTPSTPAQTNATSNGASSTTPGTDGRVRERQGSFGALAEDVLIEKIKDVHCVGIRSKTKLTKKVLDAAEKLGVIGCFCIGTNQVDLEVAAQKGIAVFNSPFSNSRSVAEL
ncbi:hypothetical protein BGZ81_002846, partial [Podila clonocystis]